MSSIFSKIVTRSDIESQLPSVVTWSSSADNPSSNLLTFNLQILVDNDEGVGHVPLTGASGRP